MRRTLRIALLLAAVAPSALRADDRVREQVLRPHDRAINARGERQTNMEAVDEARDRGDGRIVDEDTWTLDRIDAHQDRRYVPGRDFQLLDQERDRTLRIQARDRSRDPRQARRVRDIAHDEQDDAAAQVDLGIMPRDLVPRGEGGLSPLTAQLYEDEQAVGGANENLARMLKQLDEAEARELLSLRGRLDRDGRGAEFDASAAKVREDYAKWRDAARDDRERVRTRVLGRAANADATTRPATTQPAGGPPRR